MWKKPLTKSGTMAYSTPYINTASQSSSNGSSAASSPTGTHISKSTHNIHTHKNQPRGTTRIIPEPYTINHICSQPPKTTSNSSHITIRRRHQNIFIIQQHHPPTKQTTKITQQNSRLGKSRISLNEKKTADLIITGRVHKYTK